MGTLVANISKDQIRNMKELIVTLRSGQYKQIYERLKDSETGRCIQGAILSVAKITDFPNVWVTSEISKALNVTCSAYETLGINALLKGSFDPNDIIQFCRETGRKIPAAPGNPVLMNNLGEFSFVDFADFFEYCLNKHPKVKELEAQEASPESELVKV